MTMRTYAVDVAVAVLVQSLWSAYMPSVGSRHICLLRSDGVVVVCGNTGRHHGDIHALKDSAAYVQVSAGKCHTVMLRSDGVAVVDGLNNHGQGTLPMLDACETFVIVLRQGLRPSCHC